MADLMFPNIAGTAMQGFQQGQQTRANRLIGAAMQNPNQAQDYLGQAGAINPQLAMGVQGAMQMQQDRQQTMQQAQAQAVAKKAGGVARYLIAARKNGNPAQMQGAWNAAYPYAAALAQEHGAPPPPQDWNDSLLPGLYQLAAATSSAFPDEAKPQIVTPGSTVRQYGENVYTNPAAPKIENGYAVSQGPNGALVAAPIPIAGAGTTTPNVGTQGASAPAGGVSSTLPAETQAYVSKVEAALGGQPAFDQSGQPTPALLDAVLRVESGGNPQAVSPAGAQGPYQFMPATAASVGVQNPFDPTQARAGAAKYLAQLYQQFGGDADKAIAAYNAGPGRVSQATGGAQAGVQGSPQTLGQVVSSLHAKASDKPPVGYQWNADHTALEAIKGGPADKTVSGETPFAQLSPQDQAMVRKVASYEILPTNLSNYVRQGQGLTRQQILAYASVLRPDFNVNNAEAANAYIKDMAKSSPTSIGGQTQSLNMILHHLAPMMEANSALSGTGSQWINEAKNALEEKFNGNSPAGAAPGNWNQGKVYVTQELGKLLKGGVASEGEVKSLEAGLDAAKSPYQRSQAIYNIADYVHGKIQAMTDRRDKLLGSMAPRNSLLDAQAQQALRGAYQLGGVDAPDLLPPGTSYATGADFDAQPQGGQQPAQAAPSGFDAAMQKYGGG